MNQKETELNESITVEEQGDTTLDAVQSMNDTTTDEIDQTHIEMHSKNLVNVSKRLLAKYLIYHRCVCLFMIWIHLSMALISIVTSYSTSEVTSESQLCRYIFYSSHFLYGYINIAVATLYIYLFSVFSINAIKELKNSDWILMAFLGLVFYVFMLKVLSDFNCTFWGISMRQLIMQAIQFGAEGTLLKIFYEWLDHKAEIVRITLEDNIDMTRSEQLIK